ncbi:MAG: hypothetical protein EHM85_18130 [Desulfobacteraceae bacterium]|nr:MAG: hypothetical protein EHM85_18130 [Desulfobacteraceae bacterium]
MSRLVKLWTAVVFFALVLCFGIGEVLARLAHVPVFQVQHTEQSTRWAVRDPILGWRNNPGVHPAHEGPREQMTILPDGSRATGTPADADGPIVIVIGCSFVEGYGVRDDETFGWILQQRFPRARIMNFGTPGYGTYQSLQLLREVVDQRHIHPDLVIYGFVPFHSERNVLTYFMLDAFRSFGGQRFSPPHVELRNGRLEAFPPFVVPNWPFEEYSALITLLHRTELKYRLRNREKDQAQVTVLLLRRMQKFLAGKNARLLVATIADYGPPGPEEHRLMSDGMRTAGIEELDVVYRGGETRPEKLRVGGNGHPGALIHGWWAEKLGAWLERQKFLQPEQ